MKIVIRADRAIRGKVIAEHIYKGSRIIDRFVNFLLSIDEKDIYVVSDKNLKVKNAKRIPLSKIDSLKNKIVVDLKYIYDGSKLKKLIKKGESLEKAIIIENETIKNLDSFGCLYEEKEWNPLSRFYVLPLGKKISFWLSKTKVSPNFITFLNIILSVLASSLILLGGRLNFLLFGVWIIIFHILDVVDGKLARLKSQGSLFGKWIDCGGDKLVMNVWYLVITISLYLKSGKVFFLFAGLILFFGKYMYNHLLLTSVAYFRNYNFDYTSSARIKKNPLVNFALLFINMDIQLHFIMICAWIDKFEWLILFYSVYFNFIWVMYFLFYLVRYFREGDVNET